MTDVIVEDEFERSEFLAALAALPCTAQRGALEPAAFRYGYRRSIAYAETDGS
jgi:hypothetical protein